MEKRESNYEIMKHRTQAQFAAFDLNAAAKAWELEQEGDWLLLTFVGRRYRIDRRTGAVCFERDGVLQEADYNVSMTLFDILTRPRSYASGTILPVRAFADLQSSAMIAGGIFDEAAQRFDGHDAALAAACERLGGTPYGKGDVGYRLPVFRDLCVVIQFWDSDDEFGPSLNLFCDGSTLSFMRYETMMLMLVHILERLEELVES